MKGGVCANGGEQREWTPKEDAASPTSAIESVVLQSVINAKERRFVATTDIPDAFVITEQDPNDTVMVKTRGEMVTLLCLAAPEIYQECIVMENGQPVVYVKLF